MRCVRNDLVFHRNISDEVIGSGSVVYVYGTNISFKVGEKNIEYKDWVCSREGNVIFLDNVINKFNFAVKFNLNYQDDPNKKEVLKQYFNN